MTLHTLENRVKAHRVRRAMVSASFATGLAVTLFFLIMMTALWRREATIHGAAGDLGVSTDYLAATWIDYGQWMWIQRAGQTIGAATTRILRDDATHTYEMIVALRAELPLLPGMAPLELSLDVEAILNERFELETMQGRLVSPMQPATIDLFAEGTDLFYQFRGPELLVTGGELTARTALERPITMAAAIQPVVLTQSNRLRVGEQWTTRASDPLRGGMDAAVTVRVEAREDIEIDGETIDAFRVTETAGDLTTTAWYDEEGNIVRHDLGNGLILVRAEILDVYERYPSLRAPYVFDEIDREAIRRAARTLEAGAGAPGLLPWFSGR